MGKNYGFQIIVKVTLFGFFLPEDYLKFVSENMSYREQAFLNPSCHPSIDQQADTEKY